MFFNSLQCVLLGLPAIEALGVIKFVDAIEDKQYEYMYPQLFCGLGTMPGEYTIRMKEGAVPFAIFTPRRIPIPLKDPIKLELDKMVKSEVIRKVDGPTKWCAGIVPVVKPSGEVRICVDLTQLNKSVLREQFVLPTIDDALGQLAGAIYFSKLDANSGFHQVKLAKESQELTTFITPFGRYCFQRLPFGISSAPEYFQKQMAEILEGLPGVVNLMDDILVYGATQHEHDERLHAVLERLVKAGVTLNRAKCSFCVTRVAFLGYVVDSSGIRPDPKKSSRHKRDGYAIMCCGCAQVFGHDKLSGKVCEQPCRRIGTAPEPALERPRVALGPASAKSIRGSKSVDHLGAMRRKIRPQAAHHCVCRRIVSRSRLRADASAARRGKAAGCVPLSVINTNGATVRANRKGSAGADVGGRKAGVFFDRAGISI